MSIISASGQNWVILRISPLDSYCVHFDALILLLIHGDIIHYSTYLTNQWTVNNLMGKYLKAMVKFVQGLISYGSLIKLRFVRSCTVAYIPMNAAFQWQTNLPFCQTFWTIHVILDFLQPIEGHFHVKRPVPQLSTQSLQSLSNSSLLCVAVRLTYSYGNLTMHFFVYNLITSWLN